MTNDKLRFTHHAIVWIAFAALLVGLYLGAARMAGASGFPLDDAWIHQTYARNLGTRGEFAFTPGVPSAGSTAPLWTLLLAAGYALHLPFLWWTHGLNIVFLGLSGWQMMQLVRKISPDSRWLPVIIGLAVVGEWHLLWAAASGMETVLFVWLSILLMERFAAWKEMPSSRRMGALGLIGGLLTLTRPEGIGLAGLIGLAMVWQYRADARRLRRTILPFGLGFALPLIPYFAFNFAVSGLIFPNTFYAKQREYAILLENIPLWKRWLSVGGVQFVGGQILLLPGAIFGLWQAFRLKKTMPMIAATWWLTHVSLYALRLPATYQHGRYEMPTLPWLIFFGIWGTAQFLKPNHPVTWMRMLSHTGIAAIGAAIAAFVWLGVQSYANDVTFIDTEMVKTARWIDANTAPNAVIAAHDIGAIGYFSARPLVDLAGLVTPAVIPFIRDESALLEFSRARGAQYLVTFPSWYPQMTAALPEVYRTNSVWAKKHQHDNMAVFKIVDKRN